jgi:hypothetical protein
MGMPRYLIVLGLLSLVVVAMGLVSVTSGSWDWSTATEGSIVVWLVLAVLVPKWARRSKDTPPA